ncbi:MAG: Ig-like domain repeat protein [Terriglobales bacterium]
MAGIRCSGAKLLAAAVLIWIGLGVAALARPSGPSLQNIVRLVQRSNGSNGSGQESTGFPIALPEAMAYDGAGNLYIADAAGDVVLMLDTSGILTTVAGTGEQGFGGDGASATAAQLDTPTGLAVDANGNLYISDAHNDRIRKVSGGIITTIAGSGVTGFAGDGASALLAELSLPGAITVDNGGNVYFADTNNHRIRKIAASNGFISTIAGNGAQGYLGDGGAATAANLDSPRGITADAAGNVYISDTNNERIRKIDLNGIITKIAGTGSAAFGGDSGAATAAALARPVGLGIDAQGNLYIADSNNQRIRMIASSSISTVVGDGLQGFSGNGGPATSASLNEPDALAINPGGTLALGDTDNEVVREVSAGSINTGAGSGPANTVSLQLSGPASDTYGTGSVMATVLNGSTPTGMVSLLEAGNVVASGALSNGTVSLTTATVGAGVHDLVASYGGDTHNPATVSGLFVLSTSKAASVAALQTSAPAVLLKNNVVLTATVTSSTTGTPTGTVNFIDDATALGSAPLDNTGTATLPTSTLAAGPHSITTVYAGDGNFVGVTSAALSETVQDFQMSAADSAATINAGGTAHYTVQVTPTNGATFPSAVLLALAGLPPGATSMLTPSSIAAGGGTTSVTVTVQTAPQGESRAHLLNEHSRQKPFNRLAGLAAGTMLLGIVLPLPLLSGRRLLTGTLLCRNKAITLWLLALALLLMLGVVACGGGNAGSTSPQSYTMTLTGTGGALQHSTALTLTVE